MSVGQGAFRVPLCWELLDNRSGNSNATDRSALLRVHMQVLGKERIGLVPGDREFVGHAWFKWLKDQEVAFVMRGPSTTSSPMRVAASKPSPTWAWPSDSPGASPSARSTKCGGGSGSRP